jgi:hypothetical protein
VFPAGFYLPGVARETPGGGPGAGAEPAPDHVRIGAAAKEEPYTFLHVLELGRCEMLVDLDGAGKRGIDRLTIATNDRVQTFADDGFTGVLSS